MDRGTRGIVETGFVGKGHELEWDPLFLPRREAGDRTGGGFPERQKTIAKWGSALDGARSLSDLRVRISYFEVKRQLLQGNVWFPFLCPSGVEARTGK